MIRRNQAFLNKINILLDMLIVIFSYVVSSWFWLDVLDGYSRNMAAVSGRTVLLSCVYALVLFFVLSLFGFYSTTRTRRITWKLRTILFATTLTILAASALLFVFRLVDFSRGVLLVFYLLTLLLLSAKYVLMRLLFRRIRTGGHNLKHVVVLGTGPLAARFAGEAEGDRALGFRIHGFVGALPAEGAPEAEEYPIRPADRYLGSFDDLDRLLKSPDISEVVIALEPEEYRRIRDLIAACEKSGVQYSVIPFYNDIIPPHPVFETVGSSKLINMRANRLDNLGWSLLKRGFDILVSAVGLVVLSPLLLLIALGVKLSSPGPVLFRQVRVGYRRREFRMLKFRSMRVNDEENSAWTRDVDDRRTAFGSLLRKTSLDELPQLWNVLVGNMSLVGPRPELPHFVEQFRETIPLYMVKHQVKPGITGWAQIHGYRGDTSIEDRIRLDLWYIDHWSPWLDLQILIRTVFGGMFNKEKISAKQ